MKWKTTFDVAISILDGVPTEQQKAALLYTYVGEEVRDLIMMLRLPPMHEGRTLHASEYVALSEGLNEYFRTLVDESTDYARYCARKQGTDESVHTYIIKLYDLALRVGIPRDSVGFRHQFIMGLSNRDLARKATVSGLSISQILDRAGRIEQEDEITKSVWPHPEPRSET